MDLNHLDRTDKGTFKDAGPDEHRYFLASLVHYFSLIALVHKARQNNGTAAPAFQLLKETLDESKKDVTKFYFSGNIFRGVVGEDHLMAFKLERLQGSDYAEAVKRWQVTITDAIKDYDMFGDADSLKCGLTIPLELLKIVLRKQEVHMFELDPSSKPISVYIDKVYLKLKLNQRRKGSLIFS